MSQKTTTDMKRRLSPRVTASLFMAPFLRPRGLLVAAAMVAASAAAAESESATVEELVGRGFQLAAQGETPGQSFARCMPLNVNGLIDKGCSHSSAQPALFRRLEKDGEAFVCVSSIGWRCFRSGAAPATVR